MGIVLEVIGIIVMIVGVVLAATILGAAVGIPMIVQGILLFAIGSVYRNVKAIRKEIKKE